eukprot:jgi/Ulvmu1/7563/UM037_0107.1
MRSQVPRSRPTNNQLLYKAHFRWEHYVRNSELQVDSLPKETEPCASVTAAFLKVLGILQQVERGCTPKRNILQILATNTRRTKVLELSSGTHRIPDELKKHYLTDDQGSQYSTNLDRNRYGSDNNYLFTVIKHDLETLGLCPCLADVEIIDAKAQGDSQLVTAGIETCTCGNAAPRKNRIPQPVAQGECSQLFEALVAAAVDATDQADTDTAAHDPVPHEKAGQSKPAPETPANGNVAVGQSVANAGAAVLGASGAGEALKPSPRKRGGPRRVPTGLFSVNSSDLMGCGLSNLGNSGLVVGDLDFDRKDEVEQGQSKRMRRGGDGDTVSEQGDTDRYLKNVNAEAPDSAEPWRGRVRREGSVVVGNNGSVSKDVRALVSDVQHLHSQQHVLRKTVEAQKRTSVESEMLIGQLQRGVQALHEDRGKMQMTLEVTEKRIAQLEGALATSKDQISTLRNLVVGLVSNDRDQVAKVLRQGVNTGTAPHAAEARFLPDKSLPFEAPDHRAAAAVAPAGLASGGAERTAEGSRADAAAAEGGGAAPASAVVAAAAANKGSTTQAGGAQDRSNLAGLSPGAGSPDGGVDRPHAAPMASSLQPAQDALGFAESDAPADIGIKDEDTEAIKTLPKFDNFGSLSDLGSLFSGGGQGRSVDVSRPPPRANVSITSPHPVLSKPQGPADVRDEAPMNASTIPSA